MLKILMQLAMQAYSAKDECDRHFSIEVEDDEDEEVNEYCKLIIK